MIDPLLVGLGGALGAISRHLVSERVETAPADTLAVNTLGSLLLGLLTTAPVAPSLVIAAGTGFCGAFTTFSSFAFETVRLVEDGFGRRAAGYAAGTLLAAMLAVAVGAWLGRAV